MTAPATYTYIVGDNAEEAAKAAFAARYTQDDWRINAEATINRARVKGQVVWAVRYLPEQAPTLYITFAQAGALGICAYHCCGKPAQYVGFEGYRCGAHAKGGMSVVCSTTGCVNVSHTGFSSWCNECITPEQREGYERYQAEQRAYWAARPYRY
jgi:hypothetical protein